MNTFGDKIKITVFGESHAEAIGVTVDGLPAGTPVDTDYIQFAPRPSCAGQERYRHAPQGIG